MFLMRIWCVLLLLSGAGPAAAAAMSPGQWLASVLNTVQDPQTYGTDPARVLSRLGVAITEETQPCGRGFALLEDHPDVLRAADGFMLGPLADCADRHLGVLNMDVDRSALPLEEIAHQMTERLGIVPTYSYAGDNMYLHWQLGHNQAIQTQTSSSKAEANEVRISIARVPDKQ